jgi:D-psicose/D-tagatose/L-ribulose 3-epimerase
MRLCGHLLCATGFVASDDLNLIDLVQQCGYDGVEIPLLSGDVDHYQWLGSELDKRGIARTCTAICPDAATNPTSADSEVRSKGLSHLDWIVDCASALGAEVIGGPFHAPIGHFTGSGPTSDEWKRGAEAHHRMAERAAKLGMKLALEPLNRFESHYLNTSEQAKCYTQLVDHPAFGIMYDTFHAHIEEKSQPEAIHDLGSVMNVLHVSENDRGIPGTGQIDFASIFAAAQAEKFDGWVVLEAFGSGLPELAAATRIWRPMFKDHETLFQEGGDFIRSCWSQVEAQT